MPLLKRLTCKFAICLTFGNTGMVRVAYCPQTTDKMVCIIFLLRSDLLRCRKKRGPLCRLVGTKTNGPSRASSRQLHHVTVWYLKLVDILHWEEILRPFLQIYALSPLFSLSLFMCLPNRLLLQYTQQQLRLLPVLRPSSKSLKMGVLETTEAGCQSCLTPINCTNTHPCG